MPTETEKITKQASIVNKNGKNHLKTIAMRAYSGQKTKSIKNEQIAEFLPLVHKIAQRAVNYLKPPLSYDDLISAGTVGLVKAARDFDPSHKANFKTYAYIRVKGAILDELRGWSFVPPNIKKQIRKAIQTSVQIAEQTGNTPSDAELAEKLGITIDKLYKTFGNARVQHFLSIDGFTDNTPSLANLLADVETTTSYQQLEHAELIDKLVEAIQQLNERQRHIILLYYQQNLTMKQIASVFSPFCAVSFWLLSCCSD